MFYFYNRQIYNSKYIIYNSTKTFKKTSYSLYIYIL